jgi:hypothetical protein
VPEAEGDLRQLQPPLADAAVLHRGAERFAAPAPTISIYLVTAGKELIPAGAFADQSGEPSLIERA